jgi:hypothetical protein
VIDVKPQLIVDVTLYPTEKGGRNGPLVGDYFCCVCMKRRNGKSNNWDGRLMLEGLPLAPGETRQVGMVFLSGEMAAADLRASGKFYLSEGRVIGEATIVS